MTSLLSNDVIGLLRPLQKAIKETGQLIQASPWSFLAGSAQSNGNSNVGPYTLRSPSSQVPLPMTPASAALGPAVQATVPSVQQNNTNSMLSSNALFNERADALLSMTSSFNYSRTNTMSSMLGSPDGTMTPNSMLSPQNGMPSRYANGKVIF
jgi:hypothetical protein